MSAYDGDAAHWRRAATERLAALAKPPGSLGVLEDWAITLCVAQRTLAPTAEPATVVVFAGDHGAKLADESLSPYPASATQAVFRALAAGVSCTATLTRAANAQLVVVDVGVAGDLSRVEGVGDVVVEHRKVARGTADFRSGDAMDDDALAAALRAGGDALTAAAARRCAPPLARSASATRRPRRPARGADGRGRRGVLRPRHGLDDQGSRTRSTPCDAAFHGAGLAPREALRRLGGFEIAAMVGAYAAARAAGVVTLVDGSISAVAALCARKMFPESRDRMLFAAALAEEPGAAAGGAILARELAAKPADPPALLERARCGPWP
ncbi:phosphoribosyltransferase [Aureococcus anophagefferens]|nr:phosphoribosyltransferase [Aureococcus anophagefferens]